MNPRPMCTCPEAVQKGEAKVRDPSGHVLGCPIHRQWWDGCSDGGGDPLEVEQHDTDPLSIAMTNALMDECRTLSRDKPLIFKALRLLLRRPIVRCAPLDTNLGRELVAIRRYLKSLTNPSCRGRTVVNRGPGA